MYLFAYIKLRAQTHRYTHIAVRRLGLYLNAHRAAPPVTGV